MVISRISTLVISLQVLALLLDSVLLSAPGRHKALLRALRRHVGHVQALEEGKESTGENFCISLMQIFSATVKKDLQDHHQPPEWILVHAANGIVCALKYCLTCARYNWDNTLNLSWLASTKMYAILWPKWQSIFKLPTLVPRNPIGTLSLPLKLL